LRIRCPIGSFGGADKFGINSKFGRVNWSFSRFGGVFLGKTEEARILAYFNQF